MYDLKQNLAACGYSGHCENLNLLKWAIRAGASSQFYNDLICWLETQLNLVTATQQVRDNIQYLFSMLRHSVMMIPSYGSSAATNPKEFRLQTLKVLTKQLRLRKLPDVNEVESFKNEAGEAKKYAVSALNMSKNQRLVRF